MAKSKTSFRPGVSGNPGGRPKRYPEFVEAMREASPTARDKLTAAAAKGKPWAIQLVLSYAWGRPHDAGLDLSEYDTEQLVAELRARLPSTGSPDDGAH
jgi:hypothetical protein